MAHARGKIILVVGSSGSGKGVLLRYAISVYPQLQFLVSETTRAMRPGEIDGREYTFVTREVFERQRDAGSFLEWAEYGGNYYGTPKEQLEKVMSEGGVALHELEIQGVEQLVQLIPAEERLIVFIDAGGWDALKARIIKRAPISSEELEKRRERLALEDAFKVRADVVIENYDGCLEQAKQSFAKCVYAVLKSVGEVS